MVARTREAIKILNIIPVKILVRVFIFSSRSTKAEIHPGIYVGDGPKIISKHRYCSDIVAHVLNVDISVHALAYKIIYHQVARAHDSNTDEVIGYGILFNQVVVAVDFYTVGPVRLSENTIFANGIFRNTAFTGHCYTNFVLCSCAFFDGTVIFNRYTGCIGVKY